MKTGAVVDLTSAVLVLPAAVSLPLLSGRISSAFISGRL